jgi:hypothetical protein
MKISPNTKVDEILAAYPFLTAYLAGHYPRLSLLNNDMTRAAIGHGASLSRLAAIGAIKIEDLMNEIAKQVHGASGDELQVEHHREKKKPTSVVPGHPVNTYMEENAEIAALVDQLRTLVDSLDQSDEPENKNRCYTQFLNTLTRLRGVETHYIRMEHQLMPLMERHGRHEPSYSMWHSHDQVRELLKNAERAATAKDESAVAMLLPKLCKSLMELVDKENRVLLPMSLNALTSSDWARVREGEDRVGYAFTKPSDEWGGAGESGEDTERIENARLGERTVHLPTGLLSPEHVALLLNHLPVDVSFVDEYDEVAYYSVGKSRIFPRDPAVIGRKVQNCHPPSSLHMVNRILSEFRRGTKDSAEFWFDMKGKFIHVSYVAVRDDAGEYRGCLEIFQDATHIRGLTGQQRLLGWEEQ